MTTKLTIHKGQVVSVVGPMVDRAAYKAAQHARGYIMSEIRSAGRVDTGKMIAGMQVRKIGSTALKVAYEVSSSAPYTMFQNAGTRAHGPRTKKMLAFVPKGGSKVVFAKWVRGVTGAHFMEKGLMRVRMEDFV
jgi:hypothetical protein